MCNNENNMIAVLQYSIYKIRFEKNKANRIMCWHYNIAMILVSNLRTQDGIADNVLQIPLPYQKSCRISDS